MMPDDNKVANLRSAPASNKLFLLRIFGEGTWVWSNNWQKPPKDAGPREFANRHFHALPDLRAKNETASNTYYCISTFKPDPNDPKTPRKKRMEQFEAMYVAVVDDVGARDGPPLDEVRKRLEPSYVFETSPGNYHVGYMLATPLTVKRRAQHLMGSLNDHCGDPSAKGANRIVRLPYGVNTKSSVVEKCGAPFATRIVLWTGKRYTPEEIESAFNIPYRPPAKAVAKVGSDSKYKPTTDEFMEMVNRLDPTELGYSDKAVSDSACVQLGWLEVCQIAKLEYGDELRDQMAEWSARDEDDKRFNPEDWGRKWDGYKDDPEDSLRLGTLIRFYQDSLDEDPLWMVERDALQGELLSDLPGLILTGKNTPVSCLTNANIALSTMTDLRFTFDEFKQEQYCNGRVIDDAVLLEINMRIESMLSVGLGANINQQAVTHVCNQGRFDSLVNYLDGLPEWDGADYIYELCTQMQLVLPIERVFVMRWLIGCVARAYHPGCKLDTALILYGGQGKRKSTFFATLVPYRNWFSDTVNGNLSNKDELAKLRGKWIVELAELSSLKRGNNDEVAKQFMSTAEDEYRDPYARKNRKHPRRCGIGGSTNIEESNSDTTGNRRYLNVNMDAHTTQAIDWLTDSANRDLLWGHARVLYRAGELTYLTDEEAKQQELIAEVHRKKSVAEQHIESAWEEPRSCFCRAESAYNNSKFSDFRVMDDNRNHFVKAEAVGEMLNQKMNRPPSPHDTAQALRLSGWVAYPVRTPEQERLGKKATTLQFRHEGQRETAPRGFASPEFHEWLQNQNNADQARAILAEAPVEVSYAKF